MAGAWVVGIAWVGLNVCLPNLMLKLAPGESMELHVKVQPASSGFAPISVEMSQANLTHLFPRTLDYGYFTDDLDVMYVDDDGAETFEDYVIDALNHLPPPPPIIFEAINDPN